MSNVVNFRARQQAAVVRWSPMPLSQCKLVYVGEMDGKAAMLVFDADAYATFRDVAAWNLFYAFHEPHHQPVGLDELPVSGRNPRMSELAKLPDLLINGTKIRDWMVTLHPVECVLLVANKVDLPFPGTKEQLKNRALDRIAHLNQEPS